MTTSLKNRGGMAEDDEAAAAEARLKKRREAEEAKRKQDEERRCRYWTSWDSLERRVQKRRWLVLSTSADGGAKLWDLDANDDKFRATFTGQHEAAVRVAVRWTLVRATLSRARSTGRLPSGIWSGASAGSRSFRGSTVGCFPSMLTLSRIAQYLAPVMVPFATWDTTRLSVIRQIPAHEGARVSFASANFATGTAVTGSTDGRLRVWDVEIGECLTTYEGHEGAISAVLVDWDRKRVLSGSDDGTLHYWHLDSHACICALEGHSDRVNALRGDMQRGLIASASNDESMHIWDLNAARSQGQFTGHKQAVRDVAVDFDKQLAVTCSDDETLRVWDLAGMQCRATLKGHLDRVNVLSARFDRNKVISGSADCSLRLWDLESMSCEEAFYGHSGGVLSLTA
eukprot:CAMPEP_0168406758 /NCGR_PEP_ID=MMETSP0228-20121227/25815_1 /TAXON_ID=133427 /ORGANISM="Protoceratium reticulatum, Strain CCCM 535 (=CCMP 1889)" /LENGTH=398 /DNA_ID=CAMNT_0008420413 /DNA_START=14 /DNA_END=1210 /DNA_ORIENTATION=+